MPRHFVGIVEQQIEHLIKFGYHQIANMSEFAFREMFKSLLAEAAQWPYEHDMSIRVLVVIPHALVPLPHQLSKILAPEPTHLRKRRVETRMHAVQKTTTKQEFYESVLAYLRQEAKFALCQWPPQVPDEETCKIQDFVRQQRAKGMDNERLITFLKNSIQEARDTARQQENTADAVSAQYRGVTIAASHLPAFTKIDSDVRQPYLIFDTQVHIEPVGELSVKIKADLAKDQQRVITPIELVSMATHYPYKMSAGHFDFLTDDGKEFFFRSGVGWELLPGPPIFMALRQNFAYASCRIS